MGWRDLLRAGEVEASSRRGRSTATTSSSSSSSCTVADTSSLLSSSLDSSTMFDMSNLLLPGWTGEAAMSWYSSSTTCSSPLCSSSLCSSSPAIPWRSLAAAMAAIAASSIRVSWILGGIWNAV